MTADGDRGEVGRFAAWPCRLAARGLKEAVVPLAAWPVERPGNWSVLAVADNADSDEGGARLTYTYDLLGRQESILLEEDTTANGVRDRERKTVYGYDADGRLAVVDGGSGRSIQYGHDDFGRHTDTWTGTSKATATTHVEYVYDDLGRLREVKARRLNAANVNQVTRYGYDARGVLVRTELPDGETAEYGVDALGRLRRLVWEDRAGAELARFEYTVDDAGHRTKVVESIDGVGRTIEYEYDELYRLTREKVTGADAGLGGDYTIDYFFDLVGNRLRKVEDAGTAGETETAYVYNGRDQLLTETVGSVITEYGYDDNGSLTSKMTGTQADAFTYDVRNRMVAASVDGVVLEYTYDHDGERVRKIAYDQGPFEDDLEEHYLLDKQNPTGYSQVLQVFNVSFGMVTRTFVIGHRVVMHIGTSATSLRILVQDGHGSVRGLFNPSSGSNGAFVAGQVYAYDAFGVRLTQTQPSDPLLSSLLYAGEWWDNHLGRGNHRGRWLIHPIARFDAFDVYEGRIGEPLTLHKYLYANANPVYYTDPTGMSPLTERLVVGGGIALLAGLLFNFGTNGIRNSSAWWTPSNQFIPVNDAYLKGMYHSVKIRGSALTADDLFTRMSKFSQRNLFPVQASGDITGVGGEISFDMRQNSIWGNVREFGQGDFGVRVTQYDQSQRFFVVRTLGGHPLAGWRRWQVKQLPNGDLLVETFSVEHPVTYMDSTKASIPWGGNDGMTKTWTNMLWDLAQLSNGQVIYDSDTVLGGRWFDQAEALRHKPLVERGTGE